MDNYFERAAFGFHPEVTVMLPHLLRDVAGDIHDCLVAAPLTALWLG